MIDPQVSVVKGRWTDGCLYYNRRRMKRTRNAYKNYLEGPAPASIQDMNDKEKKRAKCHEVFKTVAL